MHLPQVVVIAIILSLGPLLAAQAPPQPLTLAQVKILGATHATDADAARLSGLQIGKPITVPELQTAAERLNNTGLFSKLEYRYVTAGSKMTVTFQVDEAIRDVPVVFDNFVWFSDTELTTAVQQEVPAFAGKVPRDEAIPSLVVRSLERLLKTKAIPGRVGFRPQADTQGNLLGFIFRAEDPEPRICSVSFPGATPQAQQALAAAAATMKGTDYSRLFLRGMLQGTYLGTYRRLGYWGAEFAEPIATLDAGCGGVAVSVPVKEGVVYAWEKATWSGNAAIPSQTLDSILGFRTGQAADGARLESALIDVRKAYGKIGFLRAKATPKPQLDEASKRVTFEIQVEEGPQYRMGVLTITGLPPKDAEALQKKWKLATGTVFDDTYPSDFHVKEAARYQRSGNARAEVELREGAAHTVDVTIRFR